MLFVLPDLLFIDGFECARINDPAFRTLVVGAILLMVQITTLRANFHVS